LQTKGKEGGGWCQIHGMANQGVSTGSTTVKPSEVTDPRHAL